MNYFHFCAPLRLDISREQFVDLCILMGCDYVGKIKGIGPKKGIKLVSPVLVIIVNPQQIK